MRAHGAEIWTQDVGAAQKHDLHLIGGAGEAGLGRKRVHFGGNSGYQAVNLAYLWGAQRIVLLGFDMSIDHEKRSHWFGDHPKNQGFANPVVFDSWIKHFGTMARDLSDAGVDVYNASRTSALKCFAMTTVEALP